MKNPVRIFLALMLCGNRHRVNKCVDIASDDFLESSIVCTFADGECGFARLRGSRSCEGDDNQHEQPFELLLNIHYSLWC